MWARKAYYLLKPLIPRSLQIGLRRALVARKLGSLGDVWPIDPGAAQAPEGWPGWPGGKRFALVLTHDVDTHPGYEKSLELAGLEEEAGFRSCFNFVPERYRVGPEVRGHLTSKGFEVGVHGLFHDGKLFENRKIFMERASRINRYLEEWGAVGFRAPAMHRNLEWILDLDIEYDASTFDTDPFEPYPDGAGTIFPFPVSGRHRSYVELPYSLTQDFTLFVLMQQKNIDIWKRKLDWIAAQGGMALLNVHPDYINFDGSKNGSEQYPIAFYRDFLEYVENNYSGQYWHALPKDVARFCRDRWLGECLPKEERGSEGSHLVQESAGYGVGV